MNEQDFYSEIRKMIIQETKYNRFFDGVVAELREGKAVCTIDSLGWGTPDKGAICTYIDKNSMTELKVGDNVIIGFRNNDPARAFIVGMSNDFNLQSPASYNFNTKVETIYDDRSETQELKITKDNIKKEFSITLSPIWTIKINKGSESFLKGTTWSTNWTTMATTIAGATPGTTQQNAAAIIQIQGAIATFAAQLSNMLSNTIKGE